MTEVRSNLQDCLVIDDRSSRQDCFRESLSHATTELEAAGLIAELLCPRALRGTEATDLVVVGLEQFRNGDLLQLLGAVRTVCPGWRSEMALAAVFMDIKERDELLFMALREALVPENLFGSPYGEMGIRLAGELALQTGDIDLITILGEGALGKLGGTEWQVDYAIMAATRVMPGGEERIEFIQQILASPDLPPNAASAGMGATLMAMLADPLVAEHCTEQELAGHILALLDSPLLGRNACRQMLLHLNAQQPLGALSTETWQELWQHAEIISQL
jgi:hypothetical protein